MRGILKAWAFSPIWTHTWGLLGSPLVAIWNATVQKKGAFPHGPRGFSKLTHFEGTYHLYDIWRLLRKSEANQWTVHFVFQGSPGRFQACGNASPTFSRIPCWRGMACWACACPRGKWCRNWAPSPDLPTLPVSENLPVLNFCNISSETNRERRAKKQHGGQWIVWKA